VPETGPDAKTPSNVFQRQGVVFHSSAAPVRPTGMSTARLENDHQPEGRPDGRRGLDCTPPKHLHEPFQTVPSDATVRSHRRIRTVRTANEGAVVVNEDVWARPSWPKSPRHGRIGHRQAHRGWAQTSRPTRRPFSAFCCGQRRSWPAASSPRPNAPGMTRRAP
jgi:hypothetical protein